MEQEKIISYLLFLKSKLTEINSGHGTQFKLQITSSKILKVFSCTSVSLSGAFSINRDKVCCGSRMKKLALSEQ